MINLIICIIRSLCLIISIICGIIYPTTLSNDLFLYSLGVYKGSVKGIDNYTDFKKGIIVFNHPTFFDHSVLMQSVNTFIRFLVKDKYVSLPPLKYLCNKLKCIIVEEGKTVSKIKETLNDQNIPIIAIAPASGESSIDQTDLLPFKTGAFIASDSILPIVISYFPYERWSTDESFKSAICKRLFGCFLEYHVTILPQMNRLPDETINEFSSKVKMCMESEIKLHQPIIKKKFSRPLLVLSSIFFLVCAIIVGLNRKYIHCIGIIIVFITSMWYHISDSDYAKFLDTVSNFTLGFMFTLHGILNGNFILFCYSLIACMGYFTFKSMNTLAHFFLVHIPVILGFLSLI